MIWGAFLTYPEKFFMEKKVEKYWKTSEVILQWGQFFHRCMISFAFIFSVSLIFINFFF